MVTSALGSIAEPSRPLVLRVVGAVA